VNGKAAVIYIVEDEANIRDLLAYTLNASGFEARGFAEAGAFWEALDEKAPDLVILDIMLPGEDGLSLLKKLKAKKETASLPVIMASAKDAEYDKVTGLDSGADDYLAKPFGMMELVARVKSLLRRAAGKGAQAKRDILTLGGVTADIGRHTVTAGGGEVSLTLKEFDLLVHLLRNEGIAFTRDRLLSDVWGYDYAGETRTVDNHILTLRSKLGEAGAVIKTVRGVGYKADTP
jgi:two-component system alkaline phosphatase synthesis response regulator PhoP